MLIIFDCDGVLVDSEQLAAEVLSEVLSQYNLALSAKACVQYLRGETLQYCKAWIESHFCSVLPCSFEQEVKRLTREVFAQRLRAVVGARSLLCELSARNIPFCVASNGGHGKLKHSLAVTGLLPYFDGKCFSSDDVPHGKPAPDLFLYAAQSMGVHASFCYVVEDSSPGVTAAIAAGMNVLHFAPNGSAPLAGSSQLVHLSDVLAQVGCD